MTNEEIRRGLCRLVAGEDTNEKHATNSGWVTVAGALLLAIAAIAIVKVTPGNLLLHISMLIALLAAARLVSGHQKRSVK